MKALIFKNSSYFPQIENQQNLPILHENLQQFEEIYQIKFPMEYREFLLNVANGGIGPGNGIFPLERALQYSTNLHLPWLNPTKYNDLFKYYSSMDEGESFDKRMNLILNRIESPELDLYNRRENGILYIADGGCGTNIFLVVSGTKRGQIWIDLNVTEEGYSFIADDFLSWYEKWLDRKIKNIKGKHEVIKRRNS
ncbi:SMI1/KNR4 family protein [Flagellimonas eckloniae]|nr:SMI1/KNR4 family protein [Allomuricauda eckloniae]